MDETEVLAGEKAAVHGEPADGLRHGTVGPGDHPLAPSPGHLRIDAVVVQGAEAQQFRRAGAVQRGGGSVPGGAAEGVLVHHVPGGLEHHQVIGEAFGVGAQPQAEGGRHCHLQVRIARHQDVFQFLGFLLQQVEQRGDLADGLLQAVPGEQLDVHGDLVVARAAGMDLLAHIPERGGQPGLHLRMDIFPFDGESAFHGLLMQFLQLRQQHGQLVLAEQSHFRKHGDVGHRPEDVPRGEHQIQFPVLPDRECVDLRRVIESFRPNFHRFSRRSPTSSE